MPIHSVAHRVEGIVFACERLFGRVFHIGHPHPVFVLHLHHLEGISPHCLIVQSQCHIFGIRRSQQLEGGLFQ